MCFPGVQVLFLTKIMFAHFIYDSSSVRCSVMSNSLGPPWTIVFQASLSIGFSRQEYRSGLPFPSPGDLPNPGIKPRSPALQAYSLLSEPPGKPKNTRVGSLSLSPGDLPYPGIKLGSPALKVKSWSRSVVSRLLCP